MDLESRPLELATLFSDLTRGSFRLSTLRWVGGNNDADVFFEYVFSSKMMPPTGANRGLYRNPAVNALLDEARIEGDLGKRRKLFSEIEKIVAEDTPYLNLRFEDNICVHRKRIKGIQLTPSGDYDFLRTAEAE